MSATENLMMGNYGTGQDVKTVQGDIFPTATVLNQKHNWTNYLLCGLKSLATFLVYFCIVLLLIIIINTLFDDLFYDTNDMMNSFSSWLLFDNAKMEEQILNTNQDIMSNLINLNQFVMSMLQTGQKQGPNGVQQAIDYTDPASLDMIVKIEQSFDSLLYQLNYSNQDSDDLNVLRQIDYANLQISPEFQHNSRIFKKKILDAIKIKNQTTTSSFTNMPTPTADLPYEMITAGITESDILAQQQYLAHPDNVAAFNSMLQKTDIALLGDGADSRQSVTPWGFRQISDYVSPWSGIGMGVQEPSENINYDASKIRKISFTL
jgi:hypothetical protein